MLKRILLFSVFYSLTLFAQNGLVKTYYDDGSLESELSYISGILDGPAVYYYKNGNIREEIPYSLGRVNGFNRKYFTSGLVKEERFLDDGILDGICKSYFENGALKLVLTYESGKLTKKVTVPYDSLYQASLESYLAGNRQYYLAKSMQISGATELLAVPINGVKDILNNIIYPKEAIKNKTTGNIQLNVEVDTTGKVKKVGVISGLDEKCNKACVAAVEKTKFLPGKNGGINVNSIVRIGLDFNVPDKDYSELSESRSIKKEVEKIIKPSELRSDPPKR